MRCTTAFWRGIIAAALLAGCGRLPAASPAPNGDREVVGSNSGAVLQGIGAAQGVAGIKVGVEGQRIRAELPMLAADCDCELLLLGVRPASITAIGRGENSGRQLREFNIVRQMSWLGGWNGKAVVVDQAVPRIPRDASLVVLLAQRRGDARILAAGTTRSVP